MRIAALSFCVIAMGFGWLLQNIATVDSRSIVESQDPANEDHFGADRSVEGEANRKDDEVPWSLLLFDRLDEEIHITSIDLTISEIGKVELDRHYGFDRSKIVSGSISTTESKVLKLAEYCFRFDSCLRLVVPSGIHGAWGGGGSAVGELRLTTTKGVVIVSITKLGFSMDGGEAVIESLFFAPAGAELLSLLYCGKYGQPLPLEITETLSGSRRISETRRHFQRLSWELQPK